MVIPFVSIWPNLYTPVPEYRSQQYLKWFELPEIYHRTELKKGGAFIWINNRWKVKVAIPALKNPFQYSEWENLKKLGESLDTSWTLTAIRGIDAQ